MNGTSRVRARTHRGDPETPSRRRPHPHIAVPARPPIAVEHKATAAAAATRLSCVTIVNDHVLRVRTARPVPTAAIPRGNDMLVGTTRAASERETMRDSRADAKRVTLDSPRLV